MIYDSTSDINLRLPKDIVIAKYLKTTFLEIF